MKDAVVADGLTVRKQNKTILSKLDFSVKPGSLTGLIGPSGAGKTTLMRAIVGLQRPTAGQLSVLGAPAGHKSLRSKIGYVTQEASVYPDLTVEQNLTHFGRLLGAGKGEVQQAIEQVQLQAQALQLVSSLSGGQKALVSLAVALLGRPELLVLDEPTVGLDPVLREDLWQLFNQLIEGGKTIIVSSHVMDEAGRCQNLLLVRDGQLLWRDDKQQLLQKHGVESVEQAFLKLAGHGEKTK